MRNLAVGCPLVIVCLLGPYSYPAMLGSGSPCSQEGGSSRQTDRPCYRANRSCCRSPNAVVFRLYSRFPSQRAVTYDWPIVWCSLIFPLVNPRRVWLHCIYKPNPNAVLISSHIIQQRARADHAAPAMCSSKQEEVISDVIPEVHHIRADIALSVGETG